MQGPFRIAWSRLCLGAALSGLVGACMTPSFDEVAGDRDHEKNEAIVADVVDLVKCELGNAFRDKVPEDKFRWMADWTVKSELTLQVSNSGGVAPSIGLTKLNGPGAFPIFSAVAGGSLSGQAQRVETISFTLALSELEGEVSSSRCENLKEENEEAHGRELRSGLKLRKWVEAALSPVDKGILKASFRPQPTLKLKAPTLPATKMARGQRKPSTVPPAKYAYEGFKEELEEVGRLAEVIERDAGQVLSDRCKLDEAMVLTERNIEIARARLRGVRALYPDEMLTDAGQKEIDEVERELKLLTRVKAEKKMRCENLPNFAVAARTDAAEFKDQMDHNQYLAFKKKDYLGQINAESMYLGQANSFLKGSSEQLAGARLQFEPPIDSLSHHVQFVLTKGLSASIGWGLVAIGGAGPNGNLASFSRARTHTLVMTIGPPGPRGIDEKNRLLTTSAVRGTAAIAGQ